MIRGVLRAPDGHVVVERCDRTTWPLERMRGLLARPAPPPGTALLIDPCGAVHSLFMAYPIDVVFLGRGWEILRCVAHLEPWRFAACRGARMTLELRAGEVASLGLDAVERLTWQM